ncbi:hypothetical protein [Parvibaculum sp.]|uniref:hypothetical protein n=1 Tax=Parvibaculum sp. TaxID=2024848 RepID=UPI00320FAD67
MADERKAPAINLNLSRQTVRYLHTLKRSGLHGNKIGVVARTLVQDQIKSLIQQGVLRMEFDPGDDGDDDDDGTPA